MHVIVWFDCLVWYAEGFFAFSCSKKRLAWGTGDSFFLLWSETCPQPEQRLFLMSFPVLFIAATRWRECGALMKRRRGVEKPFVKANVPSWPSRKRRERAHGSSSQARRLRRGGRTKPDRAVPNLSAKGGISSVKRGKKTSDLRSFLL